MHSESNVKVFFQDRKYLNIQILFCCVRMYESICKMQVELGFEIRIYNNLLLTLNMEFLRALPLIFINYISF